MFRKFFVVLSFAAAAVFAADMHDHSQHGDMGDHSQHGSGCAMHEGAKQCNMQKVLKSGKADPYTVKLCKAKKDGPLMLCILDTKSCDITPEKLTVTSAGKSVKPKKIECGYGIPNSMITDDIEVSFVINKKEYKTKLEEPMAEPTSTGPVNKICPVMGGKVDPKITVTHMGKTIGLCCPACVDEFKKNPDKYMSKLK